MLDCAGVCAVPECGVSCMARVVRAWCIMHMPLVCACVVCGACACVVCVFYELLLVRARVLCAYATWICVLCVLCVVWFKTILLFQKIKATQNKLKSHTVCHVVCLLCDARLFEFCCVLHVCAV